MTNLQAGMIDAALSASEVILDIYETEFAVEVKEDASPVTKADQAAEAVILEKLGEVAPTIPVVAEEAVTAGHVPTVSDRFFLVDPLDGTKEFVKRNGEFTVNIALIEKSRPIAGVIYTPVKGWLFVGEVGLGAWRGMVADPRRDHQVTNRSAIKVRNTGEAVDVIGSRSHHSPEADDYLRKYRIGEKKSIGSSLKFCLLACGEADLYPRFGKTMEWDTAAGDAILSAAGGCVVTEDGKRLQYGKVDKGDVPFVNPSFIAKAFEDQT